MLGRFVGMKKVPEGQKSKVRPDPLALHATDFAFWLRDTALHIKPEEWTAQDELKFQANNILSALGVSREKDNPNANQTEPKGN